MISVRDFHSPDSTVTSLLATSGHLRSSFFPNPPASISYGDRQYESATEALDAYISDFERSRHDPETSTGQLTLQSTPVRRRNMVTNRDVLQEHLTDSELDFLTLPLNSQRFSSRQSATDRLTLTTDEMLAIPCDGSLPVTHTSAFLCQPGTYAQGLSGVHAHLKGQNSWLSARSDPRLGSSTTAACVHHSTPTLPPRVLRPRQVSQRLEPSVRVPQPHHHHHPPSPSTETHLGTDATDAAGHPQYPRWLTSQKSEMDFSGITSIPDLKYPAWLSKCDVGSEAAPRDPSHQPQGGTHTLPSSPRPSSWLGQLEASCVEQHQKGGGKGHSEEEEEEVEVERGVVSDFLLRDRNAQYNTLRDLRMQFAERLALAEDEQRSTDIGNCFREDNIESLIQKAEKALNTPSLGLMEPLQTGEGSPTCTDHLLEAERSWDNPPVTFKSPVPVGGAVVEEMFKDKPFQATGSSSPGSRSRKHPGPVEALKQMLFSLQAVEHEVTLGQRSPPLDRAETLKLDSTPQKDEVEFEDFDTAPGGQSLKRALHHLGRLKSLVEEPRDQREKQAQPEKD